MKLSILPARILLGMISGSKNRWLSIALYDQDATSDVSLYDIFVVSRSQQERMSAMEFDDYLQPEIAVTAAVTAVVFSPGARRLLRRGVVYGLAGALMAGDAITSFSRSVGRGIQEAGATLQSQAEQRPASREGQGG